MGLRQGARSGEKRLTLLLWRACSSVAQKLKQRQGTPASLAHWMYLWRRQVLLLSLLPSTQCPPHHHHHGVLLPGPTWNIWIGVVNHNSLPLPQCCLA